jgi:hypothetical protein
LLFLGRRSDDATLLRRSSWRPSTRRGSNPKFFCLSTAATSSRSAAIRSLGEAAADRVVAVREITREIALLDGLDTSATLDRYVGIY